MNARIGHVVDVRDTRRVFGIEYRQWSSPVKNFVRVQADDANAALAALRDHVGNARYSVTSMRAE